MRERPPPRRGGVPCVTTTCRVTLEEALRGLRIDVGETTRATTTDQRLTEGHPVTVLARQRSGGWDADRVWTPHGAPVALEGFDARNGDGLPLVEGELAVVLSQQQSWLMLVRPDVLAFEE